MSINTTPPNLLSTTEYDEIIIRGDSNSFYRKLSQYLDQTDNIINKDNCFHFYLNIEKDIGKRCCKNIELLLQHIQWLIIVLVMLCLATFYKVKII